MKRLLLTLSMLATLMVGCGTPKLEVGGAYNKVTTNEVTGEVTTQVPDRVFYVVDAAFELTYSAVNTVFEYERKNRKALWSLSPDIKHGLDAVRPDADRAALTYFLARRSYKSNPTPEGLDALTTALHEIQRVATAVEATLPNH